MQIHYLSPSKLERIRLCESRVEAQLTNEDYEEEQGEAARAGTLAHEAAKLWCRPEPDGSHKYTDQNECFRAAIDACGRKEFKRSDGTVQVTSELPREVSTIEEARTFFDQICSHYKRDVLKVVFAERRYKGTLSNGVPVHLIIDLAVDRGDGTLEIIDYKTGFLTLTQDEMWDKDQVVMNLLAVRLDPEFQNFKVIKFTYFWVRAGFETGPISYSDERLKDYEHWLSVEYQRILDIKEPSESLNRFCASCGRRTECKKYRNYVSEAMGVEKVMTPEEMKALSDEDVLARYDRLGGQIKLLDEYRHALGTHLKEAMKVRQVTELGGKKYQGKLTSRKMTSHNVHTVLTLCQERGQDPAVLFNVKAKSVEALFSNDPKAMEQLNLNMKKFPTAASLNVSAVGVKRNVKPRKKKEEAAPQPEITIKPISGTGPIEAKENLSL